MPHEFPDRLARAPIRCPIVDALVAARDVWLARSPADRVAAGPEAMAACEAAVVELAARLLAIGLPVPAPITPCPDLDRAVARLDAVGPPAPPALRTLWARVGRISLVDEAAYRHVAFWSDRGVRFRRRPGDDGVDVTDGLLIEAPTTTAILDGLIEELTVQAEMGEAPGHFLSPDGYHKDDISGGGPYVLVPDGDPWLARLSGFRWCGPSRPVSAPPGDHPDLVSYLRSSVLEAAGFPGLLGDRAFAPIRRDLVHGLPVF